MFKLTPTPKQILKFSFHRENKNLQIPENWCDFAKLSDINSEGRIQKFNPYPYQIEIEKLMQDHSCVIIKGRQLGISEMVLSVLLGRACQKPGYNALVFSKTQVDSSLLAMRCKRACESIGIKLETDNLRDLIIRGGGRIRFLNSKPESSRGSESVQDILYDECAFVDDLQAIRDAATPTQSMLGDKAREYFVSTPNGCSGLYYEIASTGNSEDLKDICDRVVREKLGFYNFIDNSNWAKIFCHYQAHPIYSKNPNFLQDLHTKKRIPWETLNREHNLSFSEAEEQYFSTISLENCWVKDIKEDKGDDNSIYIAGLDTQDGGEDFCSLQIWKLQNNHFYKVAGYRKNRGTFDGHLEQILYLLSKFPNAVLGIEKNSSGNIYHGQIVNRRSYLTTHLINVNGENKGSMVSRIKAMIESGKIHYEKKDPLQFDLENYRKVGLQYRAAIGKHDDEVSSLSVMLQTAQNESLLGGF